MKKYTSLFALLIIMTLLIIEAVPQYRAFSQSPKSTTACYDPRGKEIPCPPANPVNPGNPGSPEKPGPKNRKPTPVPTAVPTLVLPHPVPYLYPIPLPYAFPYPFPVYPTPIPHIVVPVLNQNLCKIGPCWLFNLLSGDPVELLAIGGFIVFLVVIGFVFLRGRNTAGRG